MSFSSESFTADELSNANMAALNSARLVSSTLHEQFGRNEFMTKSSERDWVTEWDQWAEEKIRTELNKFSDGIGFMGEESGVDIVSDVYWAVDPIDGTSHFVRGNELCTTMISLVDHGVPVASVIYDFVRGISYTAVTGQGAYRNLSERLSTSQRPMPSAYLEIYTDEETDSGKAFTESIEATNAYLLRNACTGYTLVSVARGSTEGFVSLRNPYATVWDLAPGALLIHEAGGIVRNIGKDDFNLADFDFIASNSATFQTLERLALENRQSRLQNNLLK